MDCMKCGREIPEGQCFCDNCLSEMKQYPVKPDTAVYLPHRTASDASHKPQIHRKTLSEKEQIRLLQQRIRRLWSLVCLLLVALIAVSCLTANLVMRSRQPKPGQNYSTIAPKEAG